MTRFILVLIQLVAGMFILGAILTSLPAFARAGTLVSCDMINTREGVRYVGTYCADYRCSYTYTRVFTSYCPYSA
jgi:hypothetical protein